ncbi:c-type cytochrome biogenesis protein CcsB [Corynebacterium sp. zg254]|uniref:C-type cytochrome biogenesis protein CcsB n=1 Tax=Corynebacterium zhongnanshanii TaxID=2768834 RepID=A0ABQ6VE71_9CORY|nr:MULTISPECIES: c-type cytochrome biogenesis protein CcsB [Corynebacterium]KAB3522737.1 c-type cytochrome biogenesis protein CcsB [Corynebacterium zhongnanshanii]MCR5914204.1 c-type cytochrome biogenesis protein CcsB [Corynebacterium sp. zg254]
MMVNQNLADFSDLAFKTTIGVYLLALVFSLVYYGLFNIVAELRRDRAAALRGEAASNSQVKQKVAVGASGTAEAAGAGDGARVGEQDLPERLKDEYILRRARRTDQFGGIAQALVWLGVAVHLVHSVTRGLANSRFPWGNLFEYIMTVTLAAMLISVVMISRKSMRVMWPWILTPVVGLMFYGGTKLYAESGPLVPALNSYWYSIHVSTVSIGGSIGLISGVFSIMYLVRRTQPKGQEHGVLGKIVAPLPAAEKLDALAYRTCVWALPIFGLGVIFGAIWADGAWGRFWGWDPKETVSLITWLLYAAYLHARATPGWRNWSSWINVVAFGAMVFNLFFINMVVSGLHSYAGLS